MNKKSKKIILKIIYILIIDFVILSFITTNYAIENTQTTQQISNNIQTIETSTNQNSSQIITQNSTSSLNSTTDNSNTLNERNSVNQQIQNATQENLQNNQSDELQLYSKSSILIDSKTGQVLYEHNAYEKLYPASTTKLMTAILTVENCNLSDNVTITQDAVTGIPKSYTTAALQPGETLTVDQLLHVLLIPSANDAANALAIHVGGSIDNFAIMMNTKAKELGCLNTNFVNPNGVHNDNHYSTAYDMSLIGKYASSFDTIKQIVSQTECSLPNLPDGKERKFKTTNTLITPTNKYYYEYATGLKTGYTDKAKSCIVAEAKKGNLDLICVVLYGDKTEDKQNQRELDCHTLFDYGFSNFKETTICSKRPNC